MFDFIKNVLFIPIAFVIIIILFVIYRKAKVAKAARVAAKQQRKIQQELKQYQEQMKQEEEESERRIKAKIEKKSAETEASVAANPGSKKYRLEKAQMEVTAKTLNITEFTPISKARYIAFDLETTGLRPGYDDIVEIGAVLVENGEITKEYHQMVNPGCKMPSDASAINHITDDMLLGQPQIHEVLPAFLNFVGDDILAAHNARFDLGFICQACMRNRFRIPLGFFDTMSLARYWPEAENKKLVSLAAVAGVPIENAHRALDDARAVAGFIAATNTRRAESRKKKAK